MILYTIVCILLKYTIIWFSPKTGIKTKKAVPKNSLPCPEDGAAEVFILILFPVQIQN